MRDMKSSPEGSSLDIRPHAGLPQRPVARRRTYAPPELIEWGSLAELTLGGSGVDYDIDNGATKAV
jgi:hypothetical protein